MSNNTKKKPQAPPRPMLKSTKTYTNISKKKKLLKSIRYSLYHDFKGERKIDNDEKQHCTLGQRVAHVAFIIYLALDHLLTLSCHFVLSLLCLVTLSCVLLLTYRVQLFSNYLTAPTAPTSPHHATSRHTTTNDTTHNARNKFQFP